MQSKVFLSLQPVRTQCSTEKMKAALEEGKARAGIKLVRICSLEGLL